MSNLSLPLPGATNEWYTPGPPPQPLRFIEERDLGMAIDLISKVGKLRYQLKMVRCPDKDERYDVSARVDGAPFAMTEGEMSDLRDMVATTMEARISSVMAQLQEWGINIKLED